MLREVPSAGIGTAPEREEVMRMIRSSVGPVAITLTSFLLPLAAHAEPLAVWGFENTPPPSVADTAVYPNPLLPDLGTGTGHGVHASTGTDWTTSLGNGSLEAFSSTVWEAGDYYGFQLSTLGYEKITVSWDQIRTPLGPSSFRLVASTDGVTFTPIHDYVVISNDVGPNGGLWDENVFQPEFHYGPIALGAAFADKPTIHVRMVSLEAGASITGAVRIDNVGVEGDPLPPILELAKTDDASPPLRPGATFAYQLAVAHAAGSHQDAVEVVLSDTLPAGVAPSGAAMQLVDPDGAVLTLTVAADGDAGEIVGGVVTVRVGDLGLLDDATLTIPVVVEALTAPTSLENTASVTFVGSIGGLAYEVDSNTLALDFVVCGDAGDCPNDNPCVSSVACVAGACVPTFSTGACDDGDPCTDGDTCALGACVGGAPTTCDDDNPCTDDACAPGTGCTFTPDDANTCDDGQLSTRADRCEAGACVGTAYTCTPGVCEASSLPDGEGCVTTLAAAGTTCDDLDPCTATDACDALGACLGEPLACGEGEVCDPELGACASTHCVACADDDACGESAECVPLSTGSYCLLVCESDEDCADEEVCAMHPSGTFYCFDQGGSACPAPIADEDPEPTPEPVEPAPEPEPEPTPEPEPEPTPEAVEPAPDTTQVEDERFETSGGASCAGGGDATSIVTLWLLALFYVLRPHGGMRPRKNSAGD